MDVPINADLANIEHSVTVDMGKPFWRNHRRKIGIVIEPCLHISKTM